MPKGWWLLPSVICGSAMWAYGGWAVYKAVQGSAVDQPVAEAADTEAIEQSQTRQADAATAPVPEARHGTSQR